MKDVRRKCNSIVDLSKFIFNKKIWGKFVALGYNPITILYLSFVLKFSQLQKSCEINCSGKILTIFSCEIEKAINNIYYFREMIYQQHFQNIFTINFKW